MPKPTMTKLNNMSLERKKIKWICKTNSKKIEN